MKSLKIATLRGLALVVTLFCPFSALAGDDVEEQLKTEYVGKVLTLRHFYKGDHLVFQSDGSLIGLAEVGPWTVDSQIEVKKITVRDRGLQIRGRRVFLVFDARPKLLSDSGTKPYRDVTESLQESGAPDRDKLEEYFKAREVDIQIGLATEKPSLNEASSAMNAVFLAPGEAIHDFVPDFWRDYFDQIEGRPQTVRHAAEPVYFANQVSSMPHATYAPNPDFSEEARRGKFQGTTTVSLVVDPLGTVKDIQIVSPLGLGLDDRAVASVSTWKFDPAMKNGKPVSVRVEVEVDFHLY
jgi:TonB family protein